VEDAGDATQVPGFRLSHPSTWKETPPSLAAMKKFLELRDITLSTTDDWDQTLTLTQRQQHYERICKLVIDDEKLCVEMGSPAYVRDGSGSTVPDYFAYRNPTVLSKLVRGVQLEPPPDDSAFWVRCMTLDMTADVPKMPVLVWMRYFEGKRGNVSREWSTKTFTLGRKRQQHMDSLQYLQYHPSVEGQPGIVWFAWIAPASMKAQEYDCWIACFAVEGVIVSIEASMCSCPAGLLDCGHVCGLCMAVDEGARDSMRSCTSTECQWYGPSKQLWRRGYTESLTPAGYFEFVNERHKGSVTARAAAVKQGLRVGTRECSPTHIIRFVCHAAYSFGCAVSLSGVIVLRNGTVTDFVLVHSC
jgi:hypothetical protein